MTPNTAPTTSESDARRNYRLGVLNGVFFTFGETLISPGLVLALLVRQLGGSLTLIGLLPALQIGGYLLPQLLISGRLQAQPYKLPLYRAVAVVRVFLNLLLTASIFFATSVSMPLGLLFVLVSYALFNLCGGFSTLAFQDVVAKVIPANRRGSFFGRRQLLGGLLALVIAGPLVRWLLSDDRPLPFPANFGILSLLSLVGIGLGLAAFCAIREPAQHNPGQALSLGATLRRAPYILRANRNYRWFIIVRLLLRVAQIAEPFYIIYATEVLGLPAEVAGIYLALWALAAALSNIFWGRISDKQGNRRLLIITGIALTLAPALLIIGPWLVQSAMLGSTALIVVVGLVFLTVGAANDGMAMAAWTYLLEVAPDDERPVYIGLANTILGIGALLPVLGGWLVGQAGYGGAFAISVGVGILGLLGTRQLEEQRFK